MEPSFAGELARRGRPVRGERARRPIISGLEKLREAIDAAVDLLAAGGEGEPGVAFHAERGTGNEVDVCRLQGGVAEGGRVGDLAAGDRLAEGGGEVEERVEGAVGD